MHNTLHLCEPGLECLQANGTARTHQGNAPQNTAYRQPKNMLKRLCSRTPKRLLNKLLKTFQKNYSKLKPLPKNLSNSSLRSTDAPGPNGSTVTPLEKSPCIPAKYTITDAPCFTKNYDNTYLSIRPRSSTDISRTRYATRCCLMLALLLPYSVHALSSANHTIVQKGQCTPNQACPCTEIPCCVQHQRHLSFRWPSVESRPSQTYYTSPHKPATADNTTDEYRQRIYERNAQDTGQHMTDTGQHTHDPPCTTTTALRRWHDCMITDNTTHTANRCPLPCHTVPKNVSLHDTNNAETYGVLAHCQNCTGACTAPTIPLDTHTQLTCNCPQLQCHGLVSAHNDAGACHAVCHTSYNMDITHYNTPHATHTFPAACYDTLADTCVHITTNNAARHGTYTHHHHRHRTCTTHLVNSDACVSGTLLAVLSPHAPTRAQMHSTHPGHARIYTLAPFIHNLQYNTTGRRPYTDWMHAPSHWGHAWPAQRKLLRGKLIENHPLGTPDAAQQYYSQLNTPEYTHPTPACRKFYTACNPMLPTSWGSAPTYTAATTTMHPAKTQRTVHTHTLGTTHTPTNTQPRNNSLCRQHPLTKMVQCPCGHARYTRRVELRGKLITNWTQPTPQARKYPTTQPPEAPLAQHYKPRYKFCTLRDNNTSPPAGQTGPIAPSQTAPYHKDRILVQCVPRQPSDHDTHTQSEIHTAPVDCHNHRTHTQNWAQFPLAPLPWLHCPHAHTHTREYNPLPILGQIRVLPLQPTLCVWGETTYTTLTDACATTWLALGGPSPPEINVI